MILSMTVAATQQTFVLTSLLFFFFLFVLLLEMASDCHELFLRGETTSGVYTIQPINAEPFKVFCEMTAGKWTKTFLAACVQTQCRLANNC